HALRGHTLRIPGAGRGGAPRARDRRAGGRSPARSRARRRDGRAGAALPDPEARRLEEPGGARAPARGSLRRPRPRVPRRPRPAPRLRRGRVREARRPGARDLPQGRHLGRGQGEARGPGTLHRRRGVEERHPGAVPLMRIALHVVLLLGLAPAAAWSADLLGEAARADAALEERVHAALTRALDGDPRGAVRDMEALDRYRDALGQPPAGLTDDFRLLAAGLEPIRDVRRLALEDLLDAHPDPVVERLARHALDADDDAAAADRLLEDDRHNRRATVVNDAVRPLGVFSGAVFLAALNPFLIAGSALDSAATTPVNLWNYNRLSPRERDALLRYRTLIEHDGRTDHAP